MGLSFERTRVYHSGRDMAITRGSMASGAGSYIVIYTENKDVEVDAKRSYETSKMPTDVFSPTWFLKTSITSANGAT